MVTTSLVAQSSAKKQLPDVELKFGKGLQVLAGRSYDTGQGINIQISYLLHNNLELAARYSRIMPDIEVSFTGINEYTLGVSKYVVGHSFKIQADVSLIDETNASHNNLRYRLQTEFAF